MTFSLPKALPVTPSPYRAAIFDLDGTLIDSERLIIEAALAAFADLGFPPRRDLLVAMVGAMEDPGYPHLVAAFGPGFEAAAFDAAWARAAAPLFAADVPRRPGALRLLSALREAGIPVALATNSGTASATRKLAAAGLGAFFTPATTFGRDTVALPKPAPDMFLAAAAALGVVPAECLAFEDSDPGVAAALAAGMDVVQIPDQRPPATNAATLVAGGLLEGAVAMGLIAPIPEPAGETA